MSGADVRVSLQKLAKLSEKCAVQSKKNQSSYDDVDLSGMTPYHKNQFLLAKDMQVLRENIEKLDAMETAMSTSTASERAAVSLKIRRGMTAIKEKHKQLQRMAKEENRGDEYSVLSSHIDRTEKLYTARFRGPTAESSTPSPAEPLLGSASRYDPGITNAHYTSLHDDEEFILFFQQCKQMDQAMDHVLDRIQTGTTRMKETAMQLHSELGVQKRLLSEVDTKAERMNDAMRALNGRLKKTIAKVDQDKMCLYFLCFIILVAVVGYVLYMTGMINT